MSTDRDALNDIVAGTVGGVCQVLVGQPLDGLKVRLQVGQYNGALDCARQWIRNEGVLALYKGASSPLIGAMAHNANIFFCYGTAKRLLTQNGERRELWRIYAAGSAAAFPISLVEAPVELFKIKMQMEMDSARSSGFIGTIRRIVGVAGYRGLLQGFSATLLRNVPCMGGYFTAFEASMRLFKKSETTGLVPLYATFLSGIAGGLGFWAIFYPLETIKTRVQNDAIDPLKRNYSSIVDCARKTMAEGGIATFYRGYSVALLRAGIVNGFIFMGFSYAKRMLGDKK